MKKKPAKAKEKSGPPVIPASEIDAGILWLQGLGEPKFRDSILSELFRRMREHKQIEWFENIHGRLDKGVDYLLVTQTPLERKLLGIQIKGKPISRTGGSGALSAVEIAAECEAAMKHEFQVQGARRRLDSIAVWSSAHITPDAEEEFSKPGLAYRIQVKKPRDLFCLIEEYAPALLGQVPELALVKYIKEQADPEPEAVRVFGCPINPKLHFLEPELSEYALASMESMKTEGGHLKPRKTSVTLAKILADSRHTTVFADELSGKSYLLKRCRTVLAESRRLSILLKASHLLEPPRSIGRLLAGTLDFLSPHQVESLAQGSGLVLLVDDIDRVPQAVREWLFSLDARQFRVIAVGRSILVPKQVATIHITGTKLSSLPQFLRSLNVEHSKALLDRAQSFIERTLSASRLPKNPFTISIMLQECQHGGSKFSTPTMGRLIERFVELQLGSHSEEEFVVDFESKRDFLSHLAGKVQSEMPLTEFRRRLTRFIDSGKHPQSADNFIADFRKSGVFVFHGDQVKWAHPAFKQYFWVRNLVGDAKHKVIAQALRRKFNPTLAALVGSQIKAKDVPDLIQPLIDEVRNTPLPTLQSLVPEISQTTGIAEFLSDDEEEALLADLESSDIGEQTKERHPLARFAQSSMLDHREDLEAEKATAPLEEAPQMDKELKALIRKRLTAWMEEASQTRLECAFNLAAVLMNARKAKYEWKQRGLDAVLVKSRDFGHLLHRFFSVIFPDRKDLEFKAGWCSLYAGLHIADRMVGDPFLLNVLRGMKGRAKTSEERLQILDLLLCCGDEVGDEIVTEIKNLNRFDVTFAIYVRIVGIYYFRYHRDVEKSTLRKLLKEIRTVDKTRLLPRV